MPVTRELTPEELQHLDDQGLDIEQFKGRKFTIASDEELAQQQPSKDEGKVSIPGAIGRTLSARKGSILGGGAGAMGLGLLGTALAPETGGLSLAIPLLLGAGGAMAGSYGGEKLQHKIEGDEKFQQEQQALAEAQQQHPFVVPATDIAASAIASGGAPSLATPFRAGRALLGKLAGKELGAGLSSFDQALLKDLGESEMSRGGKQLLAKQMGDTEALKNIAIQSVINPAIMAGGQLATTGELPSLGEFGKSALGGVLFAGRGPVSKLVGHVLGERTESAPEPTAKGTINVTSPDELSTVVSPYKEKGADGQYTINDDQIKLAYKQAIPKVEKEGMSDEDYYKAKTAQSKQLKVGTDTMRDFLEKAWVEKQKALEQQQLIASRNPPLTSGPFSGYEGGELPRTTNLGDVATDAINKYVAKTGEPTTIEATPTKLPSVEELTNVVTEAWRKLESDKMAEQQMQETVASGEKKQLAQKIVQDWLKQNVKGEAERVMRGQRLSLIGDVIDGDVVRGKRVPNALETNHETHGYKAGWRYYEPQYSDRKEVYWDYEPTDAEKHALENYLSKQGIDNVKHMSMWDTSKKYSNEKSTNIPINKPRKSISIGDAITNANKADPNDPYAQLLAALNLDSQTKKVMMGEHLTEQRGAYDATDDAVRLPMNAHPSLITEEIVHAGTVRKMPAEWTTLKGAKLKEAMDSYLENGDNNTVKELVRCYYEAARQLGITEELFGINNLRPEPRVAGKKRSIVGVAGDPDTAESTLPHGYAMGDIYEFTAHSMKNREFQEALNGMESGLNDGKSLWSRFVDVLKKMFGLDVRQGSLLERTLKHVGDLTEQQRPKDQSVWRTEEQRLMGASLKATEPVIDKVAKVNHPSAEKVADAGRKVLDEVPLAVGRTFNRIMDVANKVGLTREDRKQLAEIARYENLHDAQAPASMFTNDRVQAVYNVERQVYSEEGDRQIANKEPVYRGGMPSTLIKKPYAHPTTPDPQIVETYKKNENPSEIRKLDQVFLDNALKHGYTAAEAQEALDNWKEAVQGDFRTGSGNLAHYNAVRRMQGIPLPDEFSRKDVLHNLEVYYNRRALDTSFYKHFESNPDVMSALGQTKDAWGNPIPKDPHGGIAGNKDVRALIDEFKGDLTGMSGYNEKAVSSLVTSMFINAPPLQTHKVLSNIVGITSYVDNPYQFVKVMSKAVSGIKEGFQHAKEQGLYKLTARSVLDMLSGNMTAAETMRTLGQALRKVSSVGDLTEKFNAGLMQSAFEQIVPSKISKANAGDKTAQVLMKKWDADYVLGKTYTPEEMQFLAAKASSYIHGTGDARTMPAWMLNESEISGFFKLAHWSIAQTNRFMSDIVTPATKGDYVPLLNSLFGAAVGGYLIKELREKLIGKQGQIPSLAEIASSERGLKGNIGPIAYNLMAAAQYSGFGGLLSQFAKYPFDYVYKNHPQGAVFPLDEVASDFAETLGKASSAIANDPNLNWGSLVAEVSKHIMSTNIQLGRMAVNQMVNNRLITGITADKKLLSDKLGELRRFNMVEGLPYNEQESVGNPYMNIEQKRFKFEQNPDEIAKQLPELIKGIMEKYGDKPDVMLQKIKALKENQYATMPSLENTPLSFVKYLAFLKNLKGPEEADAYLMDYLRHKAVNQAKASVVP